jgi:hypothetical protein
MEHRGIQYQVAQMTDAPGFIWTVQIRITKAEYRALRILNRRDARNLQDPCPSPFLAWVEGYGWRNLFRQVPMAALILAARRQDQERHDAFRA